MCLNWPALGFVCLDSFLQYLFSSKSIQVRAILISETQGVILGNSNHNPVQTPADSVVLSSVRVCVCMCMCMSTWDRYVHVYVFVYTHVCD